MIATRKSVHGSPPAAWRKCRRGSVLVAVLWCLALLSLVVIGALHTARMDLLVAKNFEDRIQARYLALAGVERAKALIYQEARDRSKSRKSHTGQLYSAPDLFRDVTLGRGQFRIVRRGTVAEGGGLVYGISDEESRLNINEAGSEELSRLPGITPDVVSAIIDWRDQDNAVSPGGAEIDYYASLRPPRQPRNGPLQTVRELLMVRGVSSELLLGKDRQMNGLVDAPDEVLSDPFDAGWAAMLTVHSGIENVNASGENRLDIQTADEASLAALPGMSTSLAKAIVAYRSQKRFESILDLLDVVAVTNDVQAAASRTLTQSGQVQRAANVSASSAESPSGGNPQPQPNLSGPKLIAPALLMEIADDITVGNERELPGVVNVNTASLETLSCLPGVTRELAQSIISFRQSNGFLPNIAWLFNVPGMTQEKVKQLAPRISTRSETYRILSEGSVSSTGARQRIEEIVRVNLSGTTTLGYREKDL